MAQERYTILCCGSYLTQRNRTTRVAHNYSTSNTHGMMPRLSFPHVVLSRELGYSCASLPDSRAAHRLMELVWKGPLSLGQRRFYALVLHAPSYLISKMAKDGQSGSAMEACVPLDSTRNF